MNPSHINDSQYSVEEISYEEMIVLLERQSSKASELTLEKINPSSKALNEDNLSERLAKSANQTLPSWLLNR